MKNQKVEKIRKFWDQEAEEKGTSLYATIPDFYMRQIEIDALSNYLDNDTRVIDIGCGNGY